MYRLTQDFCITEEANIFMTMRLRHYYTKAGNELVKIFVDINKLNTQNKYDIQIKSFCIFRYSIYKRTSNSDLQNMHIIEYDIVNCKH